MALLFLMAGLNAQQLVPLADGHIAEGRVEIRAGKAALHTPFGEVRITREAASAAVNSASALEAYRERAAQIPKGFSAGHAALARWCAERGFFAAAKEQMELALALQTDHPALMQAATLLARVFAPEWLLGVRRDDLAEELLLVRAARGRAEAAVALAATESMDPASLFRPALRALKLEQPHARWAAIRALARHRTEPLRIKPLFTTSLADATPVVRQEAARALALTADPVFVRLYAKNLAHPEAAIRIRAAEALGELNLPQGAEPLVAALDGAWNPARANFISTTQTAYVKDFDVEVAQGAMIADPVIDIVQSGVVLDVAVVSIQFERQVYRRVLARLLKRDFGDDPKAWKTALAR